MASYPEILEGENLVRVSHVPGFSPIGKVEKAPSPEAC